MKTCSTLPCVFLFVCACACFQLPLARAASTALPLRSDFTTGIFHDRVSRTLSTTFGSSVFAEPFQTTGSVTNDFSYQLKDGTRVVLHRVVNEVAIETWVDSPNQKYGLHPIVCIRNLR